MVLVSLSKEIEQLAFDALDIKVYASRDKPEIRGVIPLELALPTTARTSGCLIVNDYNSSTGKETVSLIPECTNMGMFVHLVL
ncbi:hypothetical protein ACFLXZ_02310 [Chloroflexota bacterium]